jgi:hypothetical protein
MTDKDYEFCIDILARFADRFHRKLPVFTEQLRATTARIKETCVVMEDYGYPDGYVPFRVGYSHRRDIKDARFETVKSDRFQSYITLRVCGTG